HPVPSGNSMLAYVLLRLARIYGDDELERRAVGVLRLLGESLGRGPTEFAWALNALDLYLATPKEIAIVGPSDSAVAKAALEPFGGIVAVDDVSLDVGKGEIVGLIGPNGAGKTTVFNLITRLYKPESGEIEFAGESLLRMPSHSVVRRGIARTFQNVELFASM